MRRGQRPRATRKGTCRAADLGNGRLTARRATLCSHVSSMIFTLSRCTLHLNTLQGPDPGAIQALGLNDTRNFRVLV